MVNISKPLTAAVKHGRRIEHAAMHTARAGAAGLKGSRQVGGSAMNMSNRANKAGIKAHAAYASADGPVGHTVHAGVAGLKGQRQIGGSAARVSNKANLAGMHVAKHKDVYTVAAAGGVGGAVGGGVVASRKKRNQQ